MPIPISSRPQAAKILPEINSAFFIALLHSTVGIYKCGCILGFKIALIAGVSVDKPQHPLVVFFTPTVHNIEIICALYRIIPEV